MQRCAIDFDKKAEKGKQRFFQEIYITSPFFSLSKRIISRKVPNKANSDSQATIQFLHFDRKIHRYSFTGTSEYKLISLRRNCFLYRFGRSPTVRRTSFFPFPFFLDRWNGRKKSVRERKGEVYDRKGGNMIFTTAIFRPLPSLNLLHLWWCWNNSNRHPIRATFIEERRRKIDYSSGSQLDDGGDVNKEACTLWEK